MEELEQLGQRDLRELALELAVGLAVAPGRVHALALLEERLDEERDLLGVGRGRQHLVEEARPPRSRSGDAAQEDEAHALRARVRAQDLGEPRRVDQRQVERRDHGVRLVGERDLERRGAVRREGRRDAARRARLADALGARRVAVGDQHRAEAAIAPPYSPTGMPRSRPSWNVSVSTSTRSLGVEERHAAVLAGRLAQQA